MQIKACLWPAVLKDLNQLTSHEVKWYEMKMNATDKTIMC